MCHMYWVNLSCVISFSEQVISLQDSVAPGRVLYSMFDLRFHYSVFVFFQVSLLPLLLIFSHRRCR